MRRVLVGLGGSAVYAVAAFACPAHAQAPSPVVLEGADEATLQAIARTLPAREAPQTAFDAERLAEEAARRAEMWMRAEGYYAGRATATADDDPPRARVAIALGARFTFAAPQAQFDRAPLDEDTREAVRLALERAGEGVPARAEDVIGAEAEAILVLQEHGFAGANAKPRTAIVDHASGLMSVTYAFAPGPRVRLAGVRVEPAGAVKQDFVDSLMTWRPGAVYAPEMTADLRRDLASTGAFSQVLVTLAPDPGEDGAREVLVRLETAKPRTIALGASYSTTEGPGVNAEWTRRNIYGRADSLTVSTTLAAETQKLGLELLRPHAASRGRARRYGAVIERETINPYDRSAITLSAAVEAAPRAKFASSYGASIAANAYSQSAGISNALILSAFLDQIADSSDERLDPKRGAIVHGRIEPALSTGAASTAFVRAVADARAYWSPGDADRATLAFRVGGGWVEPVLGAAEDLPLDRRFYAGGGGTVRGYDYNSLYPAPGPGSVEPPGGQGLLQTSLEARVRTSGPLGGAIFIDGASAFNDLEQAGDFRWGAGIGLRYNLGFAPLRLDIAVPLNRRDSDPKVAFYVSLGQAF